MIQTFLNWVAPKAVTPESIIEAEDDGNSANAWSICVNIQYSSYSQAQVKMTNTSLFCY